MVSLLMQNQKERDKMKAVKGNKVYTIQDGMKERYQKDGYDILEEDGTVLAYGKGRTVAYEEYAELKKAYEELKKVYEESRKKPEDEGTKRGKQTKKEGE